MHIDQLEQNVRDHLEKAFLEQAKAFSKSESQRSDLEKKLQQNEAEKKELQEKLEKIEAEKKEIHKKLEREDPMKVSEMKYHLKESQRKVLDKKLQETDQKLDRVLMKLRESERLHLEKRKEKGIFSVQMRQQQKQIEELQKKITKLESQKEDDEDQITVLAVKQVQSNNDLQEARKQLISGWESGETASSSLIGVKRMGELDRKPFHSACQRKYPTEADAQAVALCSLWEKYIKDSQWQPFKTSNHSKVVIDDEDEKLKKLKVEFGAEAVTAVSTALLELEEYNPSGRYTVPELWNFEEEKRASLGEGIVFLQEQFVESKKSKKMI